VLAVRELPDPVATAGQAVIDVAAADVLFVDIRLRDGWGGEWFTLTPPYVAGNGVAGVVRSVGTEVDPSWVGRRVLAQTGSNGGMSPRGGYATRAVVAESALVPVPDRLAFPEALALLHDGPTVVSILRAAELSAGQRVLITAAGGSLGTLLVPLAKAAGAEVVGAARGRRKLDFVREWGADQVVDYSSPDWTSAVGPVDVVLDGAGGDLGAAALSLVRPDGRLLAYGSSAGDFVTGPRVVGIQELGVGMDRRAALAEMLSRAVAGEITPLVGQTFPLDRAADAHIAIAARETVGKTLLLVS
jgi:NADPH2:quinone reductase